jgi:Cu/Ag efflux protein CusF
MKRATLAVYTVLILATMVWAHGDQQHVMGTVIKIDAMSIVVKTTDGSIKTVMVTPATKFVRNGSTTKLEDLKVGDRVVIHAKAMGDMLHATEVKIGGAPNEAGHQH